MDTTPLDSTPADARALPAVLLALSGALVAGIQAGGAARGFDDVRPAHGFAFARLASGGATVGELADHLGVTKQAASQLVEELVRKGYVARHPHPDDARARLVLLTDRGWACTRAADDAAADTVRPWIELLGPERFHALCADLARIAPGGPVRPSW
ncbi:MarR family winged helix-turn-helix transcriptional regulator [Streptacidiphilus sp. EB129]|uniref:MarR family winged helix-turn-helix transcriptional regulator n=1 Tax=Streptacidiphilus sp. EB129 TaxID=3156262 RepID=UPI0035141A86